jgi:dihydroorotate dehydrogenase (fumarate)
MKLATELCGIELEHPLMNAAGTCKTLEQAARFAGSAVSAVVIGSITVDERPSNSGNTYAKHESGSYSLLNAMGLPNPGSIYYREHLAEMCATIKEAGKRPIVSVAGFSPEEYALLAELAYGNGAWLVELNLGCPNVWGEEGQKPIASFSPEMIEAIIQAVNGRLDPVAFGVKLSPFSDPAQLAEVAGVLKRYSSVCFVTTSNTFPNGYGSYADGTPVITGGYGGVSGFALKPIALGQVRQLKEHLAGSLAPIDIIGVGGIRVAEDILNYRNAGADAVQAATAYWDGGENPGVFGDILADADRYFEMKSV